MHFFDWLKFITTSSCTSSEASKMKSKGGEKMLNYRRPDQLHQVPEQVQKLLFVDGRTDPDSRKHAYEQDLRAFKRHKKTPAA